MTAATRLVWDLAGRPAVAGAKAKLYTEVPGVCAICGHHEPVTAHAEKATGGNFTDQYLYRRPDTDRLCVGCGWCVSGRPPNTIRMWTLVAHDTLDHPSSPKAFLQVPGLCLTSRGDTRPVIDTLTRPPDGPWVTAVATSGQKHTIPWARINHGANQWTIRMESVDVTATPARFVEVLGAVATLRAAGHRAGDITAGRPTAGALKASSDIDWWRRWADPIAPDRNGPVADLALWCLTNERIPEHAHPRP